VKAFDACFETAQQIFYGIIAAVLLLFSPFNYKNNEDKQ